MPMSRKLAALTLSALFGLGSIAALAQGLPDIKVDPAIAGMSADQKVEARQAAMKQDGKLLRGARDARGDDAVKIATTVLQNFTNFPALFADGATNAKSEALPVVWEQFDQFTALFDKGRTAAADMLLAAQAGDDAKYQASLRTLSRVCGDCHGTYRID